MMKDILNGTERRREALPGQHGAQPHLRRRKTSSPIPTRCAARAPDAPGEDRRQGLRRAAGAPAPRQRHGLRRPARQRWTCCSSTCPDVLEQYQDRFQLHHRWTSTRTPTARSTASGKLLAAKYTQPHAWWATTTSPSTSWRGADIRNILDFEKDYPEAAVGQAGAELPLHRPHPGRGQRRDRAQHRAQAQDACSPRRAPARRSACTRRPTSATRGAGSPSDDRQAEGRGVDYSGHGAVLPHQRAVARAGGHAAARRGALLASWAARGSSTAPRSATSRPTSSWWSTPATTSRPAGSSTSRRAASAPPRRTASRPWPPAGASRSWTRRAWQSPRSPRSARARATASCAFCRRSTTPPPTRATCATWWR